MRNPASDLVLVTGASGLVGRASIPWLKTYGYRLRLLQHSMAVDPDGEVCVGDITRLDTLSKCMEGVGSVVHLAAIRRENQDATFMQINVNGVKNVIRSMQDRGVRRLIFVTGINPDPTGRNKFMHSRYLAERMIVESGLDYTILRFSFIMDINAGVVQEIRALAKKFFIFPIIGNGIAKFQPIAADDAGKIIASAVGRTDLIGKEINIGGPEILTYGEMARKLLSLLGPKCLVIDLRSPLDFLPIKIMGFLPNPPITKDEYEMLNRDNVGDSLTIVRDMFGFEPKSIDEWARQYADKT